MTELLILLYLLTYGKISLIFKYYDNDSICVWKISKKGIYFYGQINNSYE